MLFVGGCDFLVDLDNGIWRLIRFADKNIGKNG
jgi:hypothetical protein